MVQYADGGGAFCTVAWILFLVAGYSLLSLAGIQIPAIEGFVPGVVLISALAPLLIFGLIAILFYLQWNEAYPTRGIRCFRDAPPQLQAWGRLLLFFVFPTVMANWLTGRLLSYHIINLSDCTTLRGFDVFTFPDHFLNGNLWRWVENSNQAAYDVAKHQCVVPETLSRPTAIPGLQPVVYALATIVTWIATCYFTWRILRGEEK